LPYALVACGSGLPWQSLKAWDGFGSRQSVNGWFWKNYSRFLSLLKLFKDGLPMTGNPCPAKNERYNIQMAGMLKVTLVKSMIGRPEKHRKVLRGMGLTKVNRTVELQDTPAIRGMINAVSHLVKAEEKINEAK